MAEETSGFEGLGAAISGYVAPAPFADNTEINFRVLDAEFKSGVSEKGRAWAGINLVLEPEADGDTPNPATIYSMLWKPSKDDDAKRQNRALGKIKSFLDAIEYAPEGDPKTEEILGRTGRAIVRFIKGIDGNKDKNEVRYFLTD